MKVTGGRDKTKWRTISDARGLISLQKRSIYTQTAAITGIKFIAAIIVARAIQLRTSSFSS